MVKQEPDTVDSFRNQYSTDLFTQNYVFVSCDVVHFKWLHEQLK
jgi:hypothetical protein